MRSLYFFVTLLIACACYAEQKNGLQIITEFKPKDCSTTAANGDTVAVHYTGRLENGQVFDSSITKQEPIKFTLGVGKVIQGWEKGIIGMCIGERRKLIIPPELAYGANGVKDVIPPQATLTFETELIELSKRKLEVVPMGTKIKTFLSIIMWPGIAAILLVILYRRIGSDEEDERKEKAEKKARKKKH